MASESCALDTDRKLKDAKDILRYHSDSDDVLIPLDPPAKSGSKARARVPVAKSSSMGMLLCSQWLQY
jgi:hypothetical protein